MTENAPQLVARLRTDENGQPLFSEQGGHRHYELEFAIDNVPTNVYAATFELHPTYFDPVRTIKKPQDGDLRLHVTSYGDYPLKVQLRTTVGKDIWLVDKVTDALKRARPSMPDNTAIDAAIAEIANH
jgi:hypothetical protein